VGQVGILLGATKALATLGGCLVLLIAEKTLLLALKSTLGLVLGDTLSLGLLAGGKFGISLSLGLGSLLSLLAFYLGVFRGIPGVEDIAIILFILEDAAALNSSDRGGGRSAGAGARA
jgi:hypothetical protein